MHLAFCKLTLALLHVWALSLFRALPLALAPQIGRSGDLGVSYIYYDALYCGARSAEHTVSHGAPWHQVRTLCISARAIVLYCGLYVCTLYSWHLVAVSLVVASPAMIRLGLVGAGDGEGSTQHL